MRTPWVLASCLAVGIAAMASSACGGRSDGTPADGGSGEGAPEPVDAAPDADAGACLPGNVSGFQPPSSVPAAPISLACEGQDALVQSYGDACIGHAATYATCATFAVPDAGGAAACYACLATRESPDAASYGVVAVGAIPVVNYSACVAAVDPSAAGQSCALVFYATATCADYACRTTCPVTDQASFDAYTTCINDALYGPCVGYGLQSQSCRDAEVADGGTPVASVCFAGVSAEDHYLSIAQFFCGGS